MNQKPHNKYIVSVSYKKNKTKNKNKLSTIKLKKIYIYIYINLQIFQEDVVCINCSMNKYFNPQLC
jgi:hypothetical protein